mmetsp:Transcript_10606/g.26585  ORF Transcript_10606/g.26585 Transcript_10606/m.26585 type:complete len:210 (-) Transcript_10606:1020-1649(-)
MELRKALTTQGSRRQTRRLPRMNSLLNILSAISIQTSSTTSTLPSLAGYLTSWRPTLIFSRCRGSRSSNPSQFTPPTRWSGTSSRILAPTADHRTAAPTQTWTCAPSSSPFETSSPPAPRSSTCSTSSRGSNRGLFRSRPSPRAATAGPSIFALRSSVFSPPWATSARVCAPHFWTRSPPATSCRCASSRARCVSPRSLTPRRFRARSF